MTWGSGLVPAGLRVRLGHDGLRQVLGNTSWLFADRIGRMGLGLVVAAMVTRYLGPVQLGALSYSTALVAIVGSLASLGMDAIVVRDLVRSPEAAGETLGTAFTIKAIGGLLTIAVAALVVRLLRPHDDLILALVAITAAGTLAQAFDTIDFWFQSRLLAKYTVIARGLSFLLMSGARIALIFAGAPLIAFAWVTLIELVLAAAGMAIAYRLATRGVDRWRASLRRATALLAEAWPLTLSGLAIGVYMKIDMLMLGQMVGDAAVGIYGAATRVSEVWYFIPAAITTSVAPAITAAKREGDALYYDRLRRLFELLAGLALLIAIPLTFLSGSIIQLLYGASYADAGPVLALHIWAAVFVFLGVGQSCWTVNEGLTRLALSRTLAGAALNVILNLVLIPRYGALGAAIATVASYALSAMILNAFDRRSVRIFRLQLDALTLRRLLSRLR